MKRLALIIALLIASTACASDADVSRAEKRQERAQHQLDADIAAHAAPEVIAADTAARNAADDRLVVEERISVLERGDKVITAATAKDGGIDWGKMIWAVGGLIVGLLKWWQTKTKADRNEQDSLDAIAELTPQPHIAGLTMPKLAAVPDGVSMKTKRLVQRAHAGSPV